ncbi:nitrate reductase cytochrome c-type subunit [Anaeromyxobacter oryzae]|uniref:Periplasmic nitrate reductase, electron transfer subunit n=1 Tax=Anaeromyxobacter oryzae TaxID=2918170 RepID=A0ABM7WRK1_9BACT|nr:nitrate reductase cytochrome c-type subunit [Anaeromyxobacter oryzae]BDG02098.1 hypothetical protein AMOR_10940 [Anaeromyxobacter oryzae]
MIATAALLLLAATSTPDASLGLSKTGVFDVPAPPAVRAEDSSPGEKPAPPRAYPGAPPAIPHGIADFLPITRTQNLCLDCHAVKEKKPGEATPIPASHYRDLRRAPGAPRGRIAGARHVCTACHATRSDAAPLAGSTFGR